MASTNPVSTNPTSTNPTSTNPTSATIDLTAAASVAQPVPIPESGAAVGGVAAHPALTAGVRRGGSLIVWGIVGVIVLSLLALAVVAFLAASLGPLVFAVGGIMALVPLVIVFIGVRWIDRWEPEPRLAVVIAFLWGAAVAVLLAVLVGVQIDAVFASLGGSGAGYDFLSSAVQAPIVEESAKGLGVLILFWVARRYFDGPVDGLVYAAWVAGGFAFTENILYFGGQIIDAGGLDSTVSRIFLIRGLMSPFAHVMFTAAIGIAIGFGARRGVGAFGVIGYFLLGLIPAMLLHALWNGALYVVSDFFGYYAIVQFPLFVIALILVTALRRQESKLTYERLTEYATAGWFNPDEVVALATPRGRRFAIAWAKRSGRGGAMKSYIRSSTRLAFARQRLITGRDRIGAVADEAALLAAIVESRTRLATSPAATGANSP